MYFLPVSFSVDVGNNCKKKEGIGPIIYFLYWISNYGGFHPCEDQTFKTLLFNIFQLKCVLFWISLSWKFKVTKDFIFKAGIPNKNKLQCIDSCNKNVCTSSECINSKEREDFSLRKDPVVLIYERQVDNCQSIDKIVY